MATDDARRAARGGRRARARRAGRGAAARLRGGREGGRSRCATCSPTRRASRAGGRTSSSPPRTRSRARRSAPPARAPAASRRSATPSRAGRRSSAPRCSRSRSRRRRGRAPLYCDPGFLALGFLVEEVAAASRSPRSPSGACSGRSASRPPSSSTGSRRRTRSRASRGPGVRADGAVRAPPRGEPGRGERRQRLGDGRRRGARRRVLDGARRGRVRAGLARRAPRPPVARPRRRRRASSPGATRRPGSTRALGWDTPSSEGSSLGTRLGRRGWGAIGHLGFTGTSLWIDVNREVVVALAHEPGPPVARRTSAIRAFRPRFHDVGGGGAGDQVDRGPLLRSTWTWTWTWTSSSTWTSTSTGRMWRFRSTVHDHVEVQVQVGRGRGGVAWSTGPT